MYCIFLFPLVFVSGLFSKRGTTKLQETTSHIPSFWKCSSVTSPPSASGTPVTFSFRPPICHPLHSFTGAVSDILPVVAVTQSRLSRKLVAVFSLSCGISTLHPGPTGVSPEGTLHKFSVLTWQTQPSFATFDKSLSSLGHYLLICAEDQRRGLLVFKPRCELWGSVGQP